MYDKCTVKLVKYICSNFSLYIISNNEKLEPISIHIFNTMNEINILKSLHPLLRMGQYFFDRGLLYNRCCPQP